MKKIHILCTLVICTALANAAYSDNEEYSDDSMGCGVKYVNADNRPMQCVYPMGSFIFFNDADVFDNNSEIYIPGRNQEPVPEPVFEQQQSEFLN